MNPIFGQSRNPHDPPCVHLDCLVVGGALEGLRVDGDGDGEALPSSTPADKPEERRLELLIEISSLFLFDQSCIFCSNIFSESIAPGIMWG